MRCRKKKGRGARVNIFEEPQCLWDEFVGSLYEDALPRGQAVFEAVLEMLARILEMSMEHMENGHGLSQRDERTAATTGISSATSAQKEKGHAEKAPGTAREENTEKTRGDDG